MLHVKHTLTKPYITNDFIYMSTSLFCNIMILGGPFTAKKKKEVFMGVYWSAKLLHYRMISLSLKNAGSQTNTPIHPP